MRRLRNVFVVSSFLQIANCRNKSNQEAPAASNLSSISAPARLSDADIALDAKQILQQFAQYVSHDPLLLLPTKSVHARHEEAPVVKEEMMKRGLLTSWNKRRRFRKVPPPPGSNVDGEVPEEATEIQRNSMHQPRRLALGELTLRIINARLEYRHSLLSEVQRRQWHEGLNTVQKRIWMSWAAIEPCPSDKDIQREEAKEAKRLAAEQSKAAAKN